MNINKKVFLMAALLGCSIGFYFTNVKRIQKTEVPQEIRLQGAGATFPNPLYQKWVSEYQKINPLVRIDYQSIGSGGGIKSISEKTVNFAGSDAPLISKEIENLGPSNIIQIPSCSGAVVPAYNLPGITQSIRFSGNVLAEIYLGKISKWNDPKIATLNKDISLPDMSITPIWRSDGSGTTFVFTSYLSTQSDDFNNLTGSGKQVQWKTGQGGKGNEGVASSVQVTKGSIGYIELTYALSNNITFGEVQNKNNKFVKATAESVSVAGNYAKLTGNILSSNIWNQDGDSYPISSFTYIIFYKDLNNFENANQAKAFLDFISWCMNDGQKFAVELHYAPLTPAVVSKVKDALNSATFLGKTTK